MKKNKLLAFALQGEAKPFIAQLNAKKIVEMRSIKLYETAHCYIVITGIGSINMCRAIAWLMGYLNTTFPPVCWNIGTAASAELEMHQWYRIVQSKEFLTNKYFYPEIEKFTGLPLATCTTVPEPINKAGILDNNIQLADMEFYYFAKTLLEFVPSTHIHGLKWISDDGDMNFYKDKNWTTAYEQHLSKIIDIINTQTDKIQTQHSAHHTDITKYLQKTEAIMDLTFNQQVQLKNALLYAANQEKDIDTMLPKGKEKIAATHIRDKEFKKLVERLYE